MNAYAKLIIAIILILFALTASFYIVSREDKVKVTEITVHTRLQNGSVDIINIEGHLLEGVSKIGVPKGNLISDLGYVGVFLHQDMRAVSDWYSVMYTGSEGSSVYTFKVGLYDNFDESKPVKVYANVGILAEEMAAADKYILLNYSSDDTQ